MQILPSTAYEIAEELGEKDFSEEALFDPETNIRFGCCYLASLHRTFEEDWAVYAAYNAGIGRVSRWIASGIDEDSVPIEETRTYIGKVKRALIYYRNKKFATNH